MFFIKKTLKLLMKLKPLRATKIPLLHACCHPNNQNTHTTQAKKNPCLGYNFRGGVAVQFLLSGNRNTVMTAEMRQKKGPKSGGRVVISVIYFSYFYYKVTKKTFLQKMPKYQILRFW